MEGSGTSKDFRAGITWSRKVWGRDCRKLWADILRKPWQRGGSSTPWATTQDRTPTGVEGALSYDCENESHSVVSATAGTIQSMEFSRSEYWSGEPFPSPGDLPNPVIEPRSPTLQEDSLPAEPQGSPRILEWVACPFSRGSSWPRNRTGVSCIAGGFLTNWAIREAHCYDCSTYLKLGQNKDAGNAWHRRHVVTPPSLTKKS